MEKKRLRVLKFFVLIYLFFGAILLYLLYFNLGIVIEGKTNLQSGEIGILVKNNSVHLIESIEVYYVDSAGMEKKLVEIEELKPMEEKPLSVSREQAVKGVITLVAKAPYHSSVLKQIKIEELGTSELSADVQGPAKAFKESDFAILLTVCNVGILQNNVKIEQVFDQEFFNNAPESKTVSLESEKCRELNFTFNAKKTGRTTIYFNITAGEFNKRAEKTIEIIGAFGNA